MSAAHLRKAAQSVTGMLRGQRRPRGSHGRTVTGMWERLVERIAPLMDGELSGLDRLDGRGDVAQHSRSTLVPPEQSSSSTSLPRQ